MVLLDLNKSYLFLHHYQFVITPLLANLYMNRFLKYWRNKGCNKIFRARIVSYADNFVILTRDKAKEALQLISAVIEQLGLNLNQDKTVIVNTRNGNFNFLNYTFGQIWFRKTGKRYMGAGPSKKSIKWLKQKVRTLLRPGEKVHGLKLNSG